VTARPFTIEDYTRRLGRAARQAGEAGLDGVLVTPGPDLAYFTGYMLVAHTARITMLVVPAAGDPVMIVPTLERPSAEAVIGGAVALTDWPDGSDPYEATARLLDPEGRYAISDTAWALHVLGLQRTLPGSAYAPLADALPLLRAIKDDAELDRLAAAGEEVDECFAEIVRVPFAGRPEAELAAELAGLLRAHGHSHVSFTVVGSGPNGASPHHEVSDRTIEDGDMVVLDFGGVRDGYCSDITRTVHVGEPTEEEREVYEVVRAAQQAGLEAVAPGVPCEEVDRAARAVIAAAGYGEAFIHRTGHGIGLAGQEPPYLVAGETLPLEPRMCFSVEPGIYLPGRFGVRIEDIVAVTGDGRRRLNNAARELQLVA
jgi:D-alanyl-D-alanine dipeptidase